MSTPTIKGEEVDGKYDWNELAREIESKLDYSNPSPGTRIKYLEVYLYDVQGDFASGEIHGETWGPYGDGADVNYNFVYNWRTKQFV